MSKNTAGSSEVLDFSDLYALADADPAAAVPRLEKAVKRTTGKLEHERENALLTHTLALVHHRLGDLEAASAVIQALQIETVGGLSKAEIAAYLLDQIELVFQLGDKLRTRLVLRRLKPRHVAGAALRPYAARLCRYRLAAVRNSEAPDWIEAAEALCDLAESAGSADDPETHATTALSWALAICAILLGDAVGQPDRYQVVIKRTLEATAPETGLVLPPFAAGLREMAAATGVVAADVGAIAAGVSAADLTPLMLVAPALCRMDAKNDTIMPFLSTPDEVELFQTLLAQRTVVALGKHTSRIPLARAARLCGPASGVTAEMVEDAVVKIHASASGSARLGSKPRDANRCFPRVDAVDDTLVYPQRAAAAGDAVQEWECQFSAVMAKVELAHQAVEAIETM